MACPSCGPGCNYNCVDGNCVEEPRDNENIGLDISKTRGVPSAGSTNYGPRGQRQAFSRFAGDDRGTMMTMSVTKLVMGYLAVGLTAFVVGYSIMKGKDLAE